ncbi:MAG: DKNYY domain-containing protein [Aequorivita sp.]
MENSKKIIWFIYVLFLFSCQGQNDNTQIKNKDLFTIKDGDNELTLKLPINSKELDCLFLSEITDEGVTKKVSEVIDFKTFDYLYNFKEDSTKINNEYYVVNPVDNYFKDKNYVYVFQNMNEIPNFFIAGKTSNYDVLGGAYLNVRNVIYWRGNIVNGADVKTFKTINVSRNKSEWRATIGMDKNNLYNGNQIMTLENAKNSYFLSKDLLKKYFEINSD